MPTKRRRFMVNIPPDLEPLVIERTKQLRRPVANYLEWLIEKDVRPGTAYRQTEHLPLMAAEEVLRDLGPTHKAGQAKAKAASTRAARK